MDHQAFAQLLGNYGEFVGSIAVLATVFYLALQIKQYKQSLSSSTAQGTYQEINRLNTLLASDPDLAEIMERAYNEPASLDEREQRRYVWMQTCYVNLLNALYEQYKEGACTEQFFLDYAHQIKWAMGTPGGRLWRERTTAHLDVLEFIDSLAEIDRAPIPFNLA